MTPARLAVLKDFEITSRIQLALLEDLGTQTLDLEATFSNGVAVVRGEAPVLNTGEVGERITEIVTSIPEVNETELRIEWFDPYP